MVTVPSTIEQVVWACLAIGFSIFFGSNACKIFDVKTDNRPWSWKAYQFWFNFSGSFFGWVALYALRMQAAQYKSIGLTEFLLFFIGFVGITGHIPMSVMGLITSIGEVFIRAINVLKKV